MSIASPHPPPSGDSLASPGSPRWSDTFRALRRRDFRLFWLGQILSQSGTWMQFVAKGWLILRITDSPFALGYVTFLGLVPALPIALIGGAIIDRLPKRRLILMTQSGLLLQALLLALLTATGSVQVWHLIALECMFGILSAIDLPARQSFLIELVGAEDLTNAIALNSIIFNGARAFGPAVGGLILAQVGEAGCFLVNALTYLAVIVGLLLMRVEDRATEHERKALGRSMVDGFRYLLRQPLILGLISLMAMTGLFGLPYMTLMPVFARDVLAVGEQGLGFLTAAIGVGAMVGALGVASSRHGRRGTWMLAGSLVLPIVLIAFSFARQFAPALIILFVSGIAFIIQQSLINALVQSLVADRMRGRVMSIYNLLFFGMQHTGNLVSGGVAQLAGAPLAVAGGAVVCLLYSLSLNRRIPAIRQLE